MTGNFSVNFFNYTAALCIYLSDGGCKNQLISLCKGTFNGIENARTHLFNITLKTIGAAQVAGIVAGFVGWRLILVPVSSILIFGDGVYSTDVERKSLDSSINYVNIMRDRFARMFSKGVGTGPGNSPG